MAFEKPKLQVIEAKNVTHVCVGGVWMAIEKESLKEESESFKWKDYYTKAVSVGNPSAFSEQVIESTLP